MENIDNISRTEIGVTEDIILESLKKYDDFKFEMMIPGKKYEAIIVNLDTRLTIDDWIHCGRPKILSPTTNISYIPAGLHEHVIKLDPKEIPKITATAEHTFMLYLLACRNMHNSVFSARKNWMGVQVRNKNAAIFGIGRIGKLIQKYCAAFEMNVATYDKKDEHSKKRELLNWADVVFVCLTYDETTTDFFSIEDLPSCKKGQVFINTARPKIVSRDLIISALSADIWKNFCTDFLNHEDDKRYVDEDLKRFIDQGRVFLTPHIAGNTVDSFSMALDNVIKSYERSCDK